MNAGMAEIGVKPVGGHRHGGAHEKSVGGIAVKLNDRALKNLEIWKANGIEIPAFDRAAMREATKSAPVWAHFGSGNLFRAFPAVCQQTLLNRGLASCGITAVDSADMIEKIFSPHDNLTLLVRLCADGRIEKVVVGSIGETVRVNEDRDRLREILCQPSLQMVSFTITEKGYSLTDAQGNQAADVAHDCMAGPNFCISYMGRVASLLHLRYARGAAPIAMVSMDNFAHNGDRLQDAIFAFASAWRKAGVCEEGFYEYVSDPRRVSFPWSMIDKITPRPDPEIRKLLKASGFEGVEGYITRRGTYVAPFVNAEKAQHLVIEDAFPNGRPALEHAGVLFTDRQTVEKAERMKVCTCLNPVHTALAIFGCLLNYERISEEMKDPDLVRMAERIGYVEGLPVVANPGIIDPRAFLDEVLRERFPNPFLLDTPQRIACDTSQKMPIRFGETIKAYLRSPEMDIAHLRIIPLVFAAWCRYLMGVDDRGEPFEISADPMAAPLIEQLSAARLGMRGPMRAILRPILGNPALFGADLYGAGLAERVEEDFAAMLAGPGAVRATLRRRLAEKG